MKAFFTFGLFLMLQLCFETAYAYGSGSSSKSCEKPAFSRQQPAPDATVAAFSEFAFVASPNTAPASITVGLSSPALKQTFTSKDLQIGELGNGAIAVKGRLQNPIRTGFVRLNIAAKSKSGCAKADGYLIKLSDSGKAE